MKKIIVLPIILVSLFLLIGCTGTTSQGGARGAFLGGTLGVVGEFENFGVLENNIPSIFDTESFPLEVTLKNKGEYRIRSNDVTVRLLGPVADFSGISSPALGNRGEIDPISELLATGGEETLTFATDARYTPRVTGVQEREWFASVEYKYQTYLVVPEVCMKEDLRDTRVCTVKERKTFYVSGAPITVSTVEENTAGQGIIALKITVRNVGTGQVTKFGDTFGTYDKLAFSTDDPVWECKSGGKVNEARLVNNEAEILCKTRTALPQGTLQTKQLGLTLDYLYRNQIQKKIAIKQSVS